MADKHYFSLNEIALMSLCGALIFVLKIALKIPIHVPGHSALFWVIPLIVGMAIVNKPGSGTYIGIVSGLLASFFGVEALHFFDIFKYLTLGLVADGMSIIFFGRLDNPVVGALVGAVGNLAKMIVNYAIQLLFGVQAFFIILGIGAASLSHILFGAIGGLISAYLIQRLIRAGVIPRGSG